jgi:proline dehydrogenase
MDRKFDNTEIAFKYKSDNDLKRAQFLFSFMSSPLLTKIGIQAVTASMALHLPIKPILKSTIFKQFCGGETLTETTTASDNISKYNVDTILDYGVEGKESDQEFDNAVPEFINAIRYAASQKHIPFISLKITGFARFALLEKIHAGLPLTAADGDEWKRVYKRIDDICKAAYDNHIMVLIDAEETWIIEPCNQLTEAMMEKYNKTEPVVFNTYQFYCHGTLPFLKYAIEQAEKKGYILGAKLVRGAYMEKERARAKQMGYEDPIQPDKESTDRDYDEGVLLCLQHLDRLAVFIGTHNEKSCSLAASHMKQYDIKPGHPRIFFSQLYGMSDNISFNMAHEGYHVSKYLPYGPVKDVVPYLMRRAQENTSVAGQTSRELTMLRRELQRRSLLKK